MTEILAVLFDADETLIRSGIIWHEEARDFFMEEYQTTIELYQSRQGNGLRADEYIRFLQKRFGLFPNEDPIKIANKLSEKVATRIQRDGKPHQGVYKALSLVKKKNVKRAVVSSAYDIVLNAMVQRFGIPHFFHLLCSAEHDEQGKPHPAVYLRASKILEVPTKNCIGVEDSLRGIQSLHDAGIRSVAVGRHYKDPEIVRLADVCIPSLDHLNEELWQKLVHVK